MRLYNWTGNDSGGEPLRNHIPYLDACQENGLGTMVPFSNYNVTIPPANAQNSASSIVNELANNGTLHLAVKMWQVTNEYFDNNIKPEDVARLVEYIVRAEEAAGITADQNQVPIVVSVSTAITNSVPVQSMGQVMALRMAFINGGTLPDGTVVQGNDYLTSRNVWVNRFVIGVQSFQFLDEIENFVKAMEAKYGGEVPIILTEHGFDSVNAARQPAGSPFPGNGETHDVANQARIVAQQIKNTNQTYQAHQIFRGMCFFQWLNTYYKCGTQAKPYDNTCTEANFGEVEWNDFDTPQPTPSKTGTTGRGQTYPIDDAIQKTEVYQAVTTGFGSA